MYYVIKTCYVGPNQDEERYIDEDVIEISTTPAITNSSREICIEGWCGTTNDWSIHAHGEYDTIEAARAAIVELYGEVRNIKPDDGGFESGDDGTVELFKPGKYAPMCSNAVESWLYDVLQSDIDANTTDERIAELEAEYEEDANSHGYTLGDTTDLMRQRRQELREEEEEEMQ